MVLRPRKQVPSRCLGALRYRKRRAAHIVIRSGSPKLHLPSSPSCYIQCTIFHRRPIRRMSIKANTLGATGVTLLQEGLSDYLVPKRRPHCPTFNRSQSKSISEKKFREALGIIAFTHRAPPSPPFSISAGSMTSRCSFISQTWVVIIFDLLTEHPTIIVPIASGHDFISAKTLKVRAS